MKPEDNREQILINYIRTQKILFLAEQCLNLTKKSLFPLLKRFGVNHSQYLILMILRYARMTSTRVISSELSYLLGREKHSITPLLDSLSRKGLLLRERDTQDRRAVFLVLTDTGERLITELQPLTFKMLGAIPVGTDEEFGQIYTFLESFRLLAARNSNRNPDVYKQAYERLLVNGEAQLTKLMHQDESEQEEPFSAMGASGQ